MTTFKVLLGIDSSLAPISSAPLSSQTAVLIRQFGGFREIVLAGR
jgi:hypothetical protein